MVNNTNKLAVTVDIEDWYHLPPVTGAPKSTFCDVPMFHDKWKSRFDYLSKPTIQVLEMLKELNIKATFFVVADIIEYYPGLLEKINNEGHEIACHGLHHSCNIDPKTKVPLLAKEEFKERTLKAKTILERACGLKLAGYRAPNAYIAGWMIDALEELGFKYDSSVSVNSFYNKSDSSLQKVSSAPYYPLKGSLLPSKEKRSIIEIPWPYFRFIAKFPTGGGPILRFFGAKYILRGLNESLKRGDTIFYFHPIDITDDAFPLNSLITQKLFWLQKGLTIEKRIRYIIEQSDAKFTTLSEILVRY
jgi:peptidoglycan/xylan/chitin deacetylase (PgdA/CDA1 family)